jgi:hypothetical protein
MDPDYLTPTRVAQRINYLVGHLNTYILHARSLGHTVIAGLSDDHQQIFITDRGLFYAGFDELRDDPPAPEPFDPAD